MGEKKSSSPPMIAEAQRNSWSKLLTSIFCSKQLGFDLSLCGH